MVMTTHSALYAGRVGHSRQRPRRHQLNYRVFSLLLDLDELPALDRDLRLFGHNRPALFSFHDRDHGNGQVGGLKAWVTAQLASAGLIDREQDSALRIELLCYPRILGYVFNPLTVYFCYGGTGELRAILYEVCNTFHERHSYLVPVPAGAPRPIRHQADKQLYVSPFMAMDCRYHFTITPPAERVTVAIHETDAGGPLLDAVFSGRRRALNDHSLLAAFFTYPLMTLKVTAAIHWHALRLWLKGMPVYRHQPAAAKIAASLVVPPDLVIPPDSGGHDPAHHGSVPS